MEYLCWFKYFEILHTCLIFVTFLILYHIDNGQVKPWIPASVFILGCIVRHWVFWLTDTNKLFLYVTCVSPTCEICCYGANEFQDEKIIYLNKNAIFMYSTGLFMVAIFVIVDARNLDFTTISVCTWHTVIRPLCPNFGYLLVTVV